MKACERLLDIINKIPEIEKLLDHYPFTCKDITVFISLNDNCYEVQNFERLKGKLALVTINHGFVYYNKCHPKRNCYITVKKEPFEESVKIVRLLDAKS